MRCAWALGGGPSIGTAYVDYHDTVWGVPVHDERTQFEFLILEGAQAGLSWSTILRKVESYRLAFAGFDPEAVAAFGDADVERLLADPGIVRNRAKVAAAIGNARAWLELDDPVALPVVVHRRRHDPERLAGDVVDTGRDRGVPGDEQGTQAARIPVRRSDDLLRAHAGDRDGQRPRRRLLSACRVPGTSLTWCPAP